MHVEIIETSPLEREVQIAVDAQAVDVECEKALNHLKGRVKVKGFRPGKVPRRELERRYGASVRRDALKTLIQATLSDALRQDDLKTVLHVSPPEVVDDPGSGGFSYRFRAEIKPAVEAKGYLGLGLGAPIEAVTDQDLERELAKLQKQHAIVEPIDDRDVAEAEDWVTISYRRLGEGAESAPSDLSVDLTDDTLPEPLRAAIIGLTVGASATAELSGGDEAEAPPNSIEVTLQGIKRRTLPDLDELPELVGEFDDLEALSAEIRKQIEAQREGVRKRALKRQLEDRLLEGEAFEVPAAYLESRVEDEVRSQLQRYGDERLQNNAELVAEMRKGVRSDVARRVRLEFVLAAISERESVTVSDAEVDRAVEELARPAGQYANALRDLYRKPAHRAGLRERLRLDKTLDFLLSKATISEEALGGAAEAASRSDSPSSADAEVSSEPAADSHGEPEGD